MSNERNHTDPDRLLKYLAGELSERERYELERQLEKDPFAREALEGLEAVGADKAREDLLSLHQSLRKRLGRRRRIAIYGMAAAIASLLIVGSLFLQLYDFHPSQEEQEMNYPRKEAVPLSEPQVQPESSVAGEERTGTGDKKESGPQAMEAPPPSPVEKEAIGEEKSEAAAEQKTYEKDLREESPKGEVVHIEAEPSEAMPQAPAQVPRAKGMVAKSPAAVQQNAESMAAGMEQGSGNISGVILSADDLKPLQGATVSLKGSDVSTSSGTDGRFELQVTDTGNPVLVADFTGMDSREVPVHQGEDVEIMMEPSLVSLDEVAVTGKQIERSQEPALSAPVEKTDQPSESGTYSPAAPSNGFAGFKSYVEENIRLPEELESGQKEVVILRFTVTSNGDITDIEPVRSPGESYTKEALRLLMEGPAWNPARTGQVPEDDQMRLRIIFRRNGD